MMKDQIQNMTGKLRLTILNRMGEVVEEFEEKNLIVFSGYTLAAELLSGNTGSPIDRVAMGTSAQPAALTDTAITDPCYTEVFDIEYPRAGTVQFQFRFGYDEAVGLDINEFGLIAADGRLFSRKVRETLQKTAEMSVVGLWEINFLSNGE